ncbi:ABC transporter permease [Yinghuangia soli]|uniref:ABC transporter permease n=1 Tax=Yinghuangia soli TaxID=2908204 RepID=A0AA41Q973_9ACTN|nr:ABC transporter permease [Yinghuangia soli]MCF2533240.1 ABC transporter permease [Yinghuangia soli]
MGRVGPAEFRHALRAEWIKLWSVRSTWWCLGTAAVLVPVFGVLAAASADPADAALPKAWEVADGGFDPLEPLRGMLLAQFAFGVLGVLVISAEFSSGQIRSSLVAVPRRRRLLAAKLAVLVPVAAVAAAVLAFGTFFLTQAVLPDALAIGPGDGGAWRALLGLVGYSVFIAVFGFAVGTVVRRTAASVTVFLAVTFVVMSALPAVFPASMRDGVGRYTFVGLADSLTALQPDPRPGVPVAALVLAGYAAAALAAGLLPAERRDV